MKSMSSSDPKPQEGQWRRVCGSGSFHAKLVNGLEEGYVENTQAGIEKVIHLQCNVLYKVQAIENCCVKVI